jgi:thioesterase domain-containing protein
LFIAHGWGGDVHFWGEFAKLLPNQPVYGLQAAGLDGKTPRHTTIEEMAAHYVREIRAFDPGGSYRIMGFSLGALIALEMAQQLHEQRQAVPLLALLDPPTRPAPWLVYGKALAPYFRQRALFHLKEWIRQHGRESLHFKRRWRRFRRWMAKNEPRARPVLPPLEVSRVPPHVPGFRDYDSAVAASYRLRRYPGALHLIVSNSVSDVLLPLWRHLARAGATTHRIDCTHRQMIEREYLPRLAATVASALRI